MRITPGRVMFAMRMANRLQREADRSARRRQRESDYAATVEVEAVSLAGTTAQPEGRLVAQALDLMLIPLTLFAGYLLWWLLVSRGGQTPGKQIVGLRVVKSDGERAAWPIALLREPVKLTLHMMIVGFVVDGVLMLLDKQQHRSLMDKLLRTRVVRSR